MSLARSQAGAHRATCRNGKVMWSSSDAGEARLSDGRIDDDLQRLHLVVRRAKPTDRAFTEALARTTGGQNLTSSQDSGTLTACGKADL
jgi:hypothetical protein